MYMIENNLLVMNVCSTFIGEMPEYIFFFDLAFTTSKVYANGVCPHL